jgi:hypothetical protein
MNPQTTYRPASPNPKFPIKERELFSYILLGPLSNKHYYVQDLDFVLSSAKIFWYEGTMRFPSFSEMHLELVTIGDHLLISNTEKALNPVQAVHAPFKADFIRMPRAY